MNLAPDSLPVRYSRGTKLPSTILISIIFVIAFHFLTLAVVPEIEPVTISLNMNAPPTDILGSSANGGSIITYGSLS